MTDTYKQPSHGWTCFHCGETFRAPAVAEAHFGAEPGATPGCCIRVQVGEERGLLMALRKAEAEIAELQTANDQLDHEASCYHAMTSELERRFNGARSVHKAWLVLNSMEGRALAAEAHQQEAT